jgi:hypothetical protein
MYLVSQMLMFLTIYPSSFRYFNKNTTPKIVYFLGLWGCGGSIVIARDARGLMNLFVTQEVHAK